MFFYKSFPIFFKKCLTNSFPYCMIVHVPNEYVSVAQLDRASDYGSEGRVFESCHSRKKTYITLIYVFYLLHFEQKQNTIYFTILFYIFTQKREERYFYRPFLFIVGKCKESIIFQSEEQRHPSTSSDHPFLHSYPIHISLFRKRSDRSKQYS